MLKNLYTPGAMLPLLLLYYLTIPEHRDWGKRSLARWRSSLREFPNRLGSIEDGKIRKCLCSLQYIYVHYEVHLLSLLNWNVILGLATFNLKDSKTQLANIFKILHYNSTRISVSLIFIVSYGQLVNSLFVHS